MSEKAKNVQVTPAVILQCVWIIFRAAAGLLLLAILHFAAVGWRKLFRPSKKQLAAK